MAFLAYFRVKFQPVKFVGSCQYPKDYSDEAMEWFQLYLLVKRPMVVADSRSSPNYHQLPRTIIHVVKRPRFVIVSVLVIIRKNVPKTGPGFFFEVLLLISLAS